MFVVLQFLVVSIIIIISYLAWNCSFWQRNGIRGPLGLPVVGNMLSYFIARQHYGVVYENLYVKSSFPHIENACRKLNEYVVKNMKENCFEAKELFSKYTLDVVASAAYGLDAQSFTNNDSEFIKLVKNLFLPKPFSLLETIALLFSPTLGNIINYTYTPISVTEWLKAIITSVLKLRLENDDGSLEPHLDFIYWLMENKKKQNETIDPDIIIGHCSTFLLEGFETSSSLMAFAMFEFARNPKVQNKILNEIDEVLKRFNGQICHDALQQMFYFEASLYETLRLHPAMMALLKHCTKSVTLAAQTEDGPCFKVPEGMTFIVPVKAVHYDAKLFPDPLEFKPERFLADKEKRTSCSFLGFGEGPRMCPGARFGLAQTKAGLASLLSLYSVHLPDKLQHKNLEISTTTFLTAAKDGIWIKFNERNLIQ